MLQQLNQWDTACTVWLNSFHHPSLDHFMLTCTNGLFWLPLYAFILYFIFSYYKKQGWLWLGGIVFTIILTDQLSAGLIKPLCMRLRPSQEPALQHVLHFVNGYKGGLYGFVSSHAANTFGVAIFIWKLLHKKSAWFSLLFGWSIFVTYTRIYLGVHYLGDIICGALLGLVVGYGVFAAMRKLIRNGE